MRAPLRKPLSAKAFACAVAWRLALVFAASIANAVPAAVRMISRIAGHRTHRRDACPALPVLGGDGGGGWRSAPTKGPTDAKPSQISARQNLYLREQVRQRSASRTTVSDPADITPEAVDRILAAVDSKRVRHALKDVDRASLATD